MDNNYQLSRIHNYVNGLMAKEEMHILEREALNDPFLQDAIDGYKLQNGVDVRQLSLLQQQFAKRLEAKNESRHVQFFGWQRLAIGLTAAIIFVSVSILMFMRYFPQQYQEAKLQEVSIMPVEMDIQQVGDAYPIDGWGNLKSAMLSSEEIILGQLSHDIIIKGEIDENGRAMNIKLIGDTADGLLIKYYFINHVKWQGKRLDVVIKVK